MVKQEDLSLWLTGEELEGDTELVFLDEGGYREMETADGVKRVFELTVTLPNGTERQWTMNKTCRRIVARAYGEDSKSWIGKKVLVHTIEKDVFGHVKKVIYIRKCL